MRSSVCNIPIVLTLNKEDKRDNDGKLEKKNPGLCTETDVLLFISSHM